MSAILSGYRMIEELLTVRGVPVNHSTINCWIVEYAPKLEIRHRKNKPPVGISWRMDETYIKVKGCDHYLYRAVDKYVDICNRIFSILYPANSGKVVHEII